MINNKKGFSIIEAVIAMLLVAFIVGGVFTTVMASRRAIIEPTYKEDMVYAVESVRNVLKMSISGLTTTTITNGVTRSFCSTTLSNPLSTTQKTVSSCIPEACGSGSTLYFTPANLDIVDDFNTANKVTLKRTSFYIDCKRTNI